MIGDCPRYHTIFSESHIEKGQIAVLVFHWVALGSYESDLIVSYTIEISEKQAFQRYEQCM